MALIVDFLLLAASAAACFYCWVLSSKIKKLTSTENGIQTGIAALSQSAEDVQKAMTETKSATAETSVNLQALVESAEAKIPELRELITEIRDVSAASVRDTEVATSQLIETVSPYIQEAQEVSIKLLDALEQTIDADAAVTIASADQVETDEIEIALDIANDKNDGEAA